METRTTAQLRNLAREAEERGQYLTASELYQLAITRYPVCTDSQMARADISALRASARRSLEAHRQQQAHLAEMERSRGRVPDMTDPMVTTIRAALDEQHRAEFEAEFQKSVQVQEHVLPERAS